MFRAFYSKAHAIHSLNFIVSEQIYSSIHVQYSLILHRSPSTCHILDDGNRLKCSDNALLTGSAMDKLISNKQQTASESAGSCPTGTNEGLGSTSFRIQESGPPSVFSGLDFRSNANALTGNITSMSNNVNTVTCHTTSVTSDASSVASNFSSVTSEVNAAHVGDINVETAVHSHANSKKVSRNKRKTKEKESKNANNYSSPNLHKVQLTKKPKLLSQSTLESVSQYVKQNPDKLPISEVQSVSTDQLLINVEEQSAEDRSMEGAACESLHDVELPSNLDDIHQTSVHTKEKSKKKRKRNSGTKLENKSNDEGNSTENKQKRPNYFVAFQITNPMIHKGLGMVQDHIINQHGALSAAIIPLSTLHFTLVVMHLDDADIDRAKSALDDCHKRLSSLVTDPIVLAVSGIGNFRNNVVFAQVEPGSAIDRLTTVADCVSECFIEHGLTSKDDRGFKPHLTILKLSRSPKLHQKGIRKIDPSLYSELTDTKFGTQTVRGLQLCSMMKQKDKEGYYHTDHTVHLVPDTWREPDTLTFSSKDESPEHVAGRQIVTDVITSSVHHIRKQTLEISRDKKASVKNQNRAKHAIQDALHDCSSCERIKPKVFMAELEKEIAWTFELGDSLSKEEIIKLLNK